MILARPKLAVPAVATHMAQSGTFEAKNRLSELLRRAAQGEEINIDRAGNGLAWTAILGLAERLRLTVCDAS